MSCEYIMNNAYFVGIIQYKFTLKISQDTIWIDFQHSTLPDSRKSTFPYVFCLVSVWEGFGKWPPAPPTQPFFEVSTAGTWCHLVPQLWIHQAARWFPWILWSLATQSMLGSYPHQWFLGGENFRYSFNFFTPNPWSFDELHPFWRAYFFFKWVVFHHPTRFESHGRKETCRLRSGQQAA